ncbi:MAG: PEP-CTERM sorting domain-containing protein [Limisphaerales bacterium]
MSPIRILAATAALSTATAGHAAVLVNGSFEATTFGFPDGWSGNPFVVFVGDIDGPGGWPGPQDGDQFIDIGYGEISPGVPAFVLSQTVTITTPGDYRLDWYHNTFSDTGPGSGVANYHAAILNADDGTGVEDLFDPGNFGVWGQRSLTTTLEAGEYTVTFSSGPFSGRDTLLDNVTLTLVPEPGAWAALGGLGCLGWAVWRRREPAGRVRP